MNGYGDPAAELSEAERDNYEFETSVLMEDIFPCDNDFPRGCALTGESPSRLIHDYIHMHAGVYTLMCIYLGTYTHARIHANVYAYIITHKYIYTHIS